MQIEGTYKIEAPREKVFQAMTDSEYLSKAVPGCEKLTDLGSNKYELTIKIGVAAIKGTYGGKIQLDDIVVPETYKMTVEGNASMGAIKGVGLIRLADDGSNTTVTYSGDVNVSGKIAAVGSRFLGMMAKMLIDKFFNGMAEEIGKASG